MRLIDADYALKILTEDWFLEIILTTYGKSDAKKEIENAINRVETAYDVEAVVAEIEANRQRMSEAKWPHYYCKAINVKKAIEIVRNGGKE